MNLTYDVPNYTLGLRMEMAPTQTRWRICNRMFVPHSVRDIMQLVQDLRILLINLSI